MRRLNPTIIALLGGLAILFGLLWWYSANRNPDQDRIADNQLTSAHAPDSQKRCSAQATYDLIKRELFRRAAEMRGSDQAAYDQVAAKAVVRMENPVLESEDSATGASNCSGSLSLDLPPGVAVNDGRPTLTADIDYTIQPAADGSGDVLLLRNADAIINPLATLARVAEAATPVTNTVAPAEPVANTLAPLTPPAAPSPPTPPQAGARSSFDCANARTAGETAVCADSGLAALDRNMAAQYGHAMSAATPEQRALLRQTRDRFLGYRDRCPNRQCIADAYAGRMREIRDIMEGRLTPSG